MLSDSDIQRTIDAGKSNQEAVELIHNWCRHARVQKFGGVGIIEQQTGLPIGHHSMACDHASARTIASYYLKDSALDFYDQHCEKCSKRAPVGLPNILKYVEQRASDRDRERQEHERISRQIQDELAKRQEVRERIRTISSVSVGSFLDDLDAFDKDRSDSLATRLVESTRLAPELLTPEVVEHLFSLVENGERWFDETGLTILRSTTVDAHRLARCAMRCIGSRVVWKTAAAVVLENIDHVDVKDVAKAILGLAHMASPPPSLFGDNESLAADPKPLQKIFEHFPEATAKAIDDLLSHSRPYQVRMGARAATVLARSSPALMASLRRSLLTKLTRAESLIEAQHESELQEVVHDLTVAAVAAFKAAPTDTDADVMRYWDGAPPHGEARLSGVYEHAIRSAKRPEEEETEAGPADPEAYRIALKRLINFGLTASDTDVLQDVLGSFRGEPRALTWLAREQMDMLLGAAALADSKMNASPEASALIAPNDPFSEIDAFNRRSTLRTLCTSLIRWAIHGAVDYPPGLEAFTDFLKKSTELSNTFKAALLEELPPLLESGPELNAVLPFLYGAMVGESTRARGAAAKCLGELGSRRLAEMPKLVFEAFLLMLLDPYVLVHQSAVEAMSNSGLPDEYRAEARAALGNLVTVYRGEKEPEFLLKCMQTYLSSCRQDEGLRKQASKVFMALASEISTDALLRSEPERLLRQLANEDGYGELVFTLLEKAKHEYQQEKALELVNRIPAEASGPLRQTAIRAMATKPESLLIAGTLLELFSRDGEWEAAIEVSSTRMNAIPNTTFMRARKLYAMQQRCQAQFEHFLSQGKVEEALAAGQAWDAASVELDEIERKHEQADPL